MTEREKRLSAQFEQEFPKLSKDQQIEVLTTALITAAKADVAKVIAEEGAGK